MEADPTLKRLERNALVVLGVMAAGAGLARPGDLTLALGVLGGGGLSALSYLAIRSGVRSGLGPAEAGVRRRSLVKYFTRHAILALAAYGMMVRLHLDPLGMLLGVSSPVIAAGIEAARSLRSA